MSSKKTRTTSTPIKEDRTLSSLMASDNKKNLEELEISLIKIKNQIFSINEANLGSNFLYDLDKFHAKLIVLLNNVENSEKIKILIAFCYLQTLNLIKFQTIDADFERYIIPMVCLQENEKNILELKAFFWKLMIFNNNSYWNILEKSLEHENLIALIFQSDSLFESNPEMKQAIKEILNHYIKENEADQLVKPLIYDQLINNINTHKKGKVFFQICKEVIKENSLYHDKVFIKFVEIQLINAAKGLKHDNFSSLLKVIYTITKMEPSFLQYFTEKLEYYSKAGYKVRNNAIIIFYGKISSFKQSKLCFIHKNLFENFLRCLNEKSFLSIRTEIILICFKFLKNFRHLNEKKEKLSLIWQDDESKILAFCELIEKKLLQCLFVVERNHEIKLFIMDKILSSYGKSVYFFSCEFLKSFFEHLTEQDDLMKDKGYILLTNIFNIYFSEMFKENCNILENKNRVILKNGDIEHSISIFQEKSVKFEWIFIELLHMLNKIEFNKILIILNSMNNLFFCHFLQNSEKINYLIGLFYLAFSNFFENDGKTIDFKTKGYEEYVFKILGFEWKMDEDTLKNKKSIFILKALEKIIKLKFKVWKLIYLRFFGKNDDDKQHFKQKMTKYCGVFSMKRTGNMDVFEQFDCFYEKDKDFRKQFDKIIEPYEYFPNKVHNSEENDWNESFFIKYSPELYFLIDFINKNKNFDFDIIEQITMKCLYFCDELSRFENQKEYLYLISALKLILILLQNPFDEYAYTLININNFIKIVQYLIPIHAKTENENNSLLKHSELYNLKVFSLTITLKILSKFKNFSDIKNIEETKVLFTDLMKNIELNDYQIKYLGIILMKFDEISSEKSYMNILEIALQNFNVKNVNLPKNINIILAYLTAFGKENDKISIFLHRKANIFQNYMPIIEKPVSLSKSLIISNLTINKKRTLKLIYKVLFEMESKNEEIKLIISLKIDFISILLAILTNFNEVSASSLIADKHYLRINALDLLMKIISKNEIPTVMNCDLLIKLSTLCFYENIQFRKILFKILVKFAYKQENFLEIKYFALLFLFTLDEDSTLYIISKDVLNKLTSIFGEKLKILLEEKKNLTTKILENSPEYLLIYIVFIILNNSFFYAQNTTFDFYKIVKLIQNFFDIMFQNNSHRRSLSFLISILENLKKKIPKILKITENIDFKFYSIKNKNPRINGQKQKYFVENNDFLLKKDSSKKSDESPESTNFNNEKYQLVLQIISDIIRENFNNAKIIESLKKELSIYIDTHYYDENLEYEKLNVLEKNNNIEQFMENKITEKKGKKDPQLTVPKISKRKEEVKHVSKPPVQGKSIKTVKSSKIK